MSRQMTSKRLATALGLLSVIVCSLMSVALAQGETLYALGSTGFRADNEVMDLYTIDPTNGASTFIGSTGIVGLRGLASDPASGKLYSSYGSFRWNSNTGIVEIDPTTGAATHIGGPGRYVGLTFDDNGDLYGITNRSWGTDVYRIDPATGNQTFVTGLPFSGNGGLAFDWSTGRLLASYGWSWLVYDVDRGSGSWSFVGQFSGAIGWPNYITTIAFDQFGSFVAANHPVYQRRFFSVSPTTLTSSFVGTTSIYVRGLTFEGCSDCDEDGVLNADDNCPRDANAGQEDGDGDGVGDVCDICPAIVNPKQLETAACIDITLDKAGCFESDVSLIDDSGSLSGEVTIEAVADPPSQITFQILNAPCTNGETFEVFLNGVSLGSDSLPFQCTCSAGIQTFTVTDSALIASAWSADNTIRFLANTNSQNFAWVRAILDFGTSTETVCLGDGSFGSCQNTYLCAHTLRRNFDSSETLALGNTVSTTAYSDSTLPPEIDISALPDGDYVLCVSTISDLSPFTGDFVQGADAEGTNCDAWRTLRTNLTPSSYTKLTMKGTFDPVGVSCTDPVKVSQIAESLNTGLGTGVSCDGRVFRTGSCGSGMELTATGSVCQCQNPGYTVRPCINPSNPNWGGIDTRTCSGPSQTMTVEFEGGAVEDKDCISFTKSGHDEIVINGVCNQPPVCGAVSGDTAECAGAATSVGGLSGASSSDPDGDPLTFSWSTDCPNGVFDDATGVSPTLTVDSLAPDVCGPLTCDATLTVTDDGGLSDTCAPVTVSVDDTVPPTLTVDTTPITVTDTDCSGDEAVTLPTASASDTCAGATAVGNDAPATFAAGQTTTVTYTTDDGCSSSTDGVDVTVLYGADIAIRANKHTVGSGTYPGSTKEALAGIEVCAYDKATDASCSRATCGGISHQHYQCIVDSCPATSCCTTDMNGECTINAPPGDYIVISDDATKTTLPNPLGVSASDLVCGELKQKHLQQIINQKGEKLAAKTKKRTGSELLIIEPDEIVWDELEELYPFVLDATGDWSETTTVEPPEGFVRDYDYLSEDAVDEVEALQFVLTDVGTDWVPMVTRHIVRHNGRLEVVFGEIGTPLEESFARSKGLDIYGRELSVVGENAPPPTFVTPAAILDGWVEPSEVDAAWSFKVEAERDTDLRLTLETLAGVPVMTVTGGRIPSGSHAFAWTGQTPGGLSLDELQLRITADGIDKAFRLRLPELKEVYDSFGRGGSKKKGGRK